jgi:drug/metabolite transporter (DMT)-like permease
MSSAGSHRRVHAALVLVQLMFGVHYLVSKAVMQEIPPSLWALIRVSGAALLLGVVVAIARRPLPRGTDWWRLAFYSLFGVVINQFCFIQGLSRTTPTHSSVLVTSIPIATLIFAVMSGRERMSTRKLLSFLVAGGGVLLVLYPKATGAGGASLSGDLLILINAMSYAWFLVISRDILRRVDPLTATAVLLAFGSLGMLGLGLPTALRFDFSSVSAQAWGMAAFVIIFPTALAYLLNYWALARADSSLVAFYIYLQPLVATGLSIWLLSEKLAASTIVGTLLIFAAVYMALSGRRVASPSVSGGGLEGQPDK